jgi:hypothetical protein
VPTTPQAAAVQTGDPLEPPRGRRLGDLGSDSDDTASERPRESHLTPATRLLRQGEGESEVIVGAAPSAAVDDPQASTQPMMRCCSGLTAAASIDPLACPMTAVPERSRESAQPRARVSQ